jgi:hypothetical protein
MVDCLDAMFATAKITQPITKFHYWALAKLPFSLIATVRPLSRDPTAVSDPYKKLQELLLRSYGLSAEQMTSKWLDYPMCGDTRPSVLWDNLTSLQPATVKEAQTVLFIRKLPRHIRNRINPRAFKELEDLIQRCNKLWAAQTPEEAAAEAPVPLPEHPSLSLPIPPQRIRRRQIQPPPLAHPGANQRRPQRSPVFLPLPLRQQGPQVREGLLLPGKLIGRRLALTSPPPPVLSQPAAPPSFSVPELATAMSTLPIKNLIFLHDSQNYPNS